MKKLINKVKHFLDLSELSRSTIFWNGLLLVLLILSLIFCPNMFIMFQCFGSLICFAKMFDGDMEKEDIWMLYTIVPWFFLVLVGIGYLIYLIYKHTILRFNRWLDNKTDEDE